MSQEKYPTSNAKVDKTSILTEKLSRLKWQIEDIFDSNRIINNQIISITGERPIDGNVNKTPIPLEDTFLDKMDFLSFRLEELAILTKLNQSLLNDLTGI